VASVPLLCLGSAAALSDGRQWNAMLVDGRILLDLPPTAVLGMHRHGVDLASLDVVLISHLHADHVFGLPFLLLEYAVRCERRTPLYVVGPPGLRAQSETLYALAWPGMAKSGLRPRGPIEYVEVEPRREVRVSDLVVSATPMSHFGMLALGYRFTCRGIRFAYTGDTGDCSELEELLSDADVAVMELTHPTAKNDPGHLDIERLAYLTEDVRKRGMRLFATHMSERPTVALDGVTLCEDGQTYWV
jgi:ribonuclease BN (tRNA processing enzyme)